MRRKPKLKYTEMCMYIDENIRKPDADVAKIYDYLVMVSYMLAVKRRFFNREDYYDNFAYYFATSIYSRMTNKRQYLDKDDKDYIEPIKSCLNYMKHTIYARKVEFCNEEFAFISEESDIDTFKEAVYTPVSEADSDLLRVEIDRYFATIDRMVKEKIYGGVYGKDKVLCWKLYTATLLSLLRNFTLSNRNAKKLIDFRHTNRYNQRHADCRVYVKNNYEDLLADVMEEETKDAPIAYDLPSEYLDYIALTMQKIKIEIVRDIQSLISDYTITDDMVEDILLGSLPKNDEESFDD